MNIQILETKRVERNDILELYKANEWSSAEKPDELHLALLNSHALITAWHDNRLVGLGNAISDGHLVVYYPHLIIHPSYQGMGIGKQIVEKLQDKYQHFHQQVLVADGDVIQFYKKCGFEKAGSTQSMWIYQGNDHS